MSRWASVERRLRFWLWAIGAGLSLSFYAMSPAHRSRHTPLGTERRLFGLGRLSVRLIESPSTKQWMLASEDALFTLPWQWQPPSLLWRIGTLRQASGTWHLDGATLRSAWVLAATGWLDDRRLCRDDGYGDFWVFDLRRRRLTRGDWSEMEAARAQENAIRSSDSGYRLGDDTLSATLASPLEGLAADARGSRTFQFCRVGGKALYLVCTLHREDAPVTLYAVSDEPAPRTLSLTRNARPLALSRDGRTLFFRRDDALWRLDFRRPLPDLLAEIPVPELPDPLATGQ